MRGQQSRQMLQEMGREPTPKELAVCMEMPEDKVRRVLKIAKSRSPWKRRSVTTMEADMLRIGCNRDLDSSRR